MSYKHASVNPLALFLKPQSPAERLAAQERDREKLQRERQLRSRQRKQEAKATGEAVMKRSVGRPCMQLQQASFSFPICVCPLCGYCCM
jgi:hypothetical protein